MVGIDDGRAKRLAAVRRAHKLVAEARESVDAAVAARTTALVQAHDAGVTWDALAKELGVSRPRVIDMARERETRNARRRKTG